MKSLLRLVVIVLLASFAFGGSFTCKGSTHDDDTPTKPRR